MVHAVGMQTMLPRKLARIIGVKFDETAVLISQRKLSRITDTNSDDCKLCDVEHLFWWLQNCQDVRALKKLHGHILIHGLGRNIFLCSKILNCYSDFGILLESKLAFQNVVNNDPGLCNSAMVGYFRAGYIEEVLLLYKVLKLHRVRLDGRTITFGLKSCAELNNLFMGKGIHVDSVKFGLSGDKFVGSSLVGLYSKHGVMDDSHRAFEEILDKDTVAYTAMITGYSHYVNSTAWNAFKIATDMHMSNLEVNRVTLVSLLQAAGNLGALKEGKSMHCYSIRRGIGVVDEVLQTSIVDMYAILRDMRSAYAFLKNMRGTVAPWNALLVGLNRIGEYRDAIQYFFVMLHEHKLVPDLVTLTNALSACAELSYASYAASIHARLIRSSIPLDIVLATALIEVYSKCCRVAQSRRLFAQLMIKDVVSYNTMIYGYIQNSMADEAIKLLKQMMAECVAPNSITVLCVVLAFADQRDLIRGRWIHGFAIKHGFCSDVDIANQILHMYSTCGNIEAAKVIFNSLARRNLISWTAMMMGCLSCGCTDEVIRLYQLMQQHGEKPDSVTLITALQAVSELGYLKVVKQIHSFIYRALLENDTITINSLITAYAKCGRLDLSVGLFFSLEDRGLDSWNTMISVYGMHGCFTKVLELFKQMEEEDIEPDELTFSSVLSACSHAGLVEEGWHVFQSMTSVYSILPREEHYSCIVDLMGRAGHLKEAYDFVKLSSALKDKSSAFCALLSGCRTHRNALLGQIISKDLLDLKPQSPGTYALISDVYVQDGQWKESANLRTRAKESGLRKLPGSSLVESEVQAMKLC